MVTDLKRVIAYSTMSQIGYMIMAVCSAAYAAGMFHLMTHAFFKALLFMSAGSVISAMGGVQNLDKMGGFRKVMPFTFGCMVIGGLALSGIPPFSGFFSKDEILSIEFERGGWHTFLGIAGYLGAFLTAIYTFRMIFRAFFGKMVPEAEELSHGHLYHAPEPTNPATGEVEDTDVGFPGPEHHIAEREVPMKVAMGSLAVLAIIGGFLQIPGISSELHHFLEPTFADSELYEDARADATSQEWIGLIVGGVIGIAGIALAWTLWGHDKQPVALRQKLAPLHNVLRPQVVLRRADRLPDRAAVRVVRALRQQHLRARVRQRRARRRLHRRRAHPVRRGPRHPVGLPALLRRAAARRAYRAERLLPDLRMIHLSILVFFPVVCALLGAFNPRVIGMIATLIPLVYAVMLVADFDPAGGLQHVTDDAWIPELGIRYKLGIDGLNLWLSC